MSSDAKTEAKFEIQRIYIKDLSFEAPNTPQIFMENWQPEVQLNLETKTTRLDENMHEVILTINATVTSQKKTAFIIEVQHAGVFVLSGFSKEQLPQMLGSFCPSILFPYVREVISDVVMRGGFPQLLLAPVNFDALYHQHLQDKKVTTEETDNHVH